MKLHKNEIFLLIDVVNITHYRRFLFNYAQIDSFKCDSFSYLLILDCKERVVVQNKLNLLLNIILYNTLTLQLFTMNIIKMNWELFTKDN